MRIATTLEVLRRGALGETPDQIAKGLLLGPAHVTERLKQYGWPDLERVAAEREQLRAGCVEAERGAA